jgi:hypothetical protein
MFVSIPLQQCSFDLSVLFSLHFLTHYKSVYSSTKICDFFDIVEFNKCHVQFFCSGRMRLLRI